MKKKILLSFMLICIGIFAFGMSNTSAYTETKYGDYLYYTVSNDKVTITDCSNSATTIEIPSKINGYPVTSIDNFAFSGCTGLTSITIPNSVRSIGGSAFKNCTGLTQINWNAKNVSDFTSSSEVFESAGTSEDGINVVFGDDVKHIPAHLFYVSDSWYRPKITSVTIGKSVTSVGSFAFSGCTGLTSVSIPNSVTNIGSYAFYYCTGLTSITIPKSVTSIGSYAFYGCSGLTQINWNAKKTNDFSLKHSNSDSAFENAGTSGGGINVVFGDDVKYIPAYLFCYVNVKTVTIGDSVTGIGNGAFFKCTGLTQINWNAKKVSDFTSENGVFVKAGANGDGINIVFGDDVEYIPAYLFYVYDSSYRPKITSVTIGKNVTSIGGSAAFSGCTGLTSITIPSVNQICKAYGIRYDKTLSSVFGSKNTLTSITLTNETAIPDSAFSDYTNLTDITLNDGITSIGANAFYNCGYANDETNWDGEYLYLGNYLIDVKPTVFAAKVKDGTTVMADSIFTDCSDLLKATLPESLINISNNAFSGCSNLLGVTVPSNVNRIGSYAFSGCNKLTKINIPAAVTEIGNRAFSGCGSLEGVYITDIESWCKITFGGDSGYWDDKSSNPLSCAGKLYINDILVSGIIVPESITQLNDYVFYNCENLKVINLPNSLTAIGNCAFYNCDALTDITIPDSVTSIGTSAFYDCDALQKIDLSDNLTTIGSSAFYGCGNLTQINIPAGITDIGSDAFGYCNNLSDVYITDLSAWCKLDFDDIDKNPLHCGANLHLNNTLITELSIPSDITVINKNTFYNCDGIKRIKLHDNVERIEDNAFYSCSNVEYVEIPVKLFYIKNNAFYGCDNISEVYYGGTAAEWDEIIIAGGNDAIINATPKSIYYIKLIADDDSESSITCLPNETIKLSDIEKKYMRKVTLYTDEAMTQEFDLQTEITDNMTLYAKLGEEITVISGDIDDDGEITMNDAIYLFNAAMFPDEYPIPAGQKTDYNGDGTFDMNDAIYLFNHAMFPEEYPI